MSSRAGITSSAWKTPDLFLATTAIDKFWRKDEEILFLGTWCLRRDREDVWRQLRYRVMPSPWNDRQRFHEAASYVENVWQQFLLRLADYCNSVHGTGHSTRYWRIVLGPWLVHAIHTAYDRYTHLQEALRLVEPRTVGLRQECYRVPSTTAMHFQWLVGDHYNLQIYTQLLELLGVDMDRQTMEPEANEPAGSLVGRLRSSVGLAADALVQVLERRLVGRVRVALYDPYVTRFAAWGLSVRSGFTVLARQSGTVVESAPPQFDSRRIGLTQVEARSEFERLFARLLPYQFPTAFLEGYTPLARSAAASPAVDVIASAAGWHFSEKFKLKAAALSEKGSRVVALQHGGGYGMYRFAPAESVERGLSDRFMVWGWADQDPSKLRNIPGPGLSRAANRRPSTRRVRRNRLILFVSTAHPRYLYRFHSSPVGSQWEDYFEWQDRFLSAISGARRRNLIYRPMPVDYGQAVRERLTGRFPDMQWDDILPAAKRLRSCRFVVIDHCATTLLEALAANVPTILFWDSKRWEMRSEADLAVEALRHAKILFSSPEEAAAHLERHYADSSAWWGDPLVQAARETFVNRFARASADWQRDWIDVLISEADRPKREAVTRSNDTN